MCHVGINSTCIIFSNQSVVQKINGAEEKSIILIINKVMSSRALGKVFMIKKRIHFLSFPDWQFTSE